MFNVKQIHTTHTWFQQLHGFFPLCKHISPTASPHQAGMSLPPLTLFPSLVLYFTLSSPALVYNQPCTVCMVWSLVFSLSCSRSALIYSRTHRQHNIPSPLRHATATSLSNLGLILNVSNPLAPISIQRSVHASPHTPASTQAHLLWNYYGYNTMGSCCCYVLNYDITMISIVKIQNFVLAHYIYLIL